MNTGIGIQISALFLRSRILLKIIENLMISPSMKKLLKKKS
jgi:hypothetical protein